MYRRTHCRILLSAVTLTLSLLTSATLRAAPYVYAHHPVSTAIPAAQAAFDRGLTLLYAYQSEEAQKAFRTAAQLDPQLAMAWWGIALTLGPDFNTAPELASTQKAAAAIARARQLAVKHTSVAERDYIEALAPRTSGEAQPDFDQLALHYRDAMRALMAKYPKDADAAALFAEAAMDVHPWRLWSSDGQPSPGTQELVEAIERGLQYAPHHLGLLHFYIHAVEASTTPERALAAARQLAALHMEPAATHLVHMPAHTFLRVGDWAAAIRANEHAVHDAVDFKVSADPSVHQACAHCLGFLSYAYSMSGQSAEALRTAQILFDLLGDPTTLINVLARFHRTAQLQAMPEPTAAHETDGRDLHTTLALWHYGRGIAALDSGDLTTAGVELEALDAQSAQAKPAPTFADTPNVTQVYDQLGVAIDAAQRDVAHHLLTGRLAIAHGNLSIGVSEFTRAVAVQESAQYGEPPFWPYPARNLLAAAQRKLGDRAGAERVLREGLLRVPHDPVALTALRALLNESGRVAEAATLATELQSLSAHADVPFDLDPL